VFMGMANPSISTHDGSDMHGAGYLTSFLPRHATTMLTARVSNLHRGVRRTRNLYSGAVFGAGNTGNYAAASLYQLLRRHRRF